MTHTPLSHVPLRPTRLRADNASLSVLFNFQPPAERRVIDQAEALSGDLAQEAWGTLRRTSAFVYNSDMFRVDHPGNTWEVVIPGWVLNPSSQPFPVASASLDLPLTDRPLATYHVRVRVRFAGEAPVALQGAAELPLISE